MKRLSLTIGALLGGWLSVSVLAQGPSPAQIQAALRAFLTQAHTWTATQTFAGISVSSCTGCGGGSITGSDTQVLFFDGANNPAGDAGFVWLKTPDAIQVGVNYSLVTTTPTPGLRVGSNADGQGSQIILGSDDQNTGAPVFSLYSSNGTTTAPTPSIAGNTLGTIESRGYTANGRFASAASIVFDASDVILTEVWGGMSFIAIGPVLGNATYLRIDGNAGTITVPQGLVIADGQALRGDTTSGHTFSLSAYDNNTGPGYVAFATLTNGNAPSLVIAPPAGGSTVTITADSTTSKFTANGSSPSVDDTSGGNSCGAAGNPSMAANSTDNAGGFNVGAGGGTDCTVTYTVAAPHFWACTPSDETSAVLVRAVSVNTTTTKFQGVMGAADVVRYLCTAY